MGTSVRNRLRGTIEKIVSDKVVSEVVIQTAAGTVTPIIHNRFGEANESQTRRYSFCDN